MNKQTLLSKVFMWMFIGLFVTFLTGYVVSLNPNMLLSLFGGVGYVFCVICELLLVIFLSARISKMSPTTAKVSFLLYSFVTGLTFASIFIVYELTSIIYVFLITALVFGVFAFIGSSTKLDLIMNNLTEEEHDIVRRARNAKTHNIAKNSDIETYKKATAFEALVGFLYLTGQTERLSQILNLSILEK